MMKTPKKFLGENVEQGWPVMLCSLDCMHWCWKTCLTGWKGQYNGDCKDPTIILDAIETNGL
jgi:hypothetical protein